MEIFIFQTIRIVGYLYFFVLRIVLSYPVKMVSGGYFCKKFICPQFLKFNSHYEKVYCNCNIFSYYFTGARVW